MCIKLERLDISTSITPPHRSKAQIPNPSRDRYQLNANGLRGWREEASNWCVHYSKFLSDRGGGEREGLLRVIEFWDKLLKVGLNLCYFMRWACWMENYKWDCRNGRVNGNKLVKVEVILDYFMRFFAVGWGGVFLTTFAICFLLLNRYTSSRNILIKWKLVTTDTDNHVSLLLLLINYEL